MLAVAQAIGSSAIALVTFVGGLVGTELAPAPAWATLPVSASVLGNAVMTLPAALLMKRIGRRAGFAVAALAAALAAILAAVAIGREAFGLFCAATALIGGSGAFVLQYRFAAAESVDKTRLGTAVAVVLAGGIAAGFLGPRLGQLGRDLSALGPFAGSFLVLMGLEVLAMALLAALYREGKRETPPPGGPADARGGRRAALRSLSNPSTAAAIVAACCASGVMTFNMTAAPLGMHVLGHHTLSDTSFAIQSHIIAMYVPSFFTGFLIARLSLFAVMMAGGGLLVSSAVVGMLGTELWVYWLALVLLGLGWNLLFVGGTTLLARSYDAQNRFAVQGLNDFLVVGTQALASLMSSVVLFGAGRYVLAGISIGLVGVVSVVLVAVHRTHGPLGAEPAPGKG